jgi:hypothetical protein
MTQRITIYGFIVDRADRRNYALVDLVYFVKDELARVEDIFAIVNSIGYNIVSKKIPGTNTREANRVDVEDWSDHIKIGVEKIETPEFMAREGYGRYNPPPVI